MQVTTDANGDASFSASVPVAVPAGQIVTATATDPAGNTSELRARPGGPEVDLLVAIVSSIAPMTRLGPSAVRPAERLPDHGHHAPGQEPEQSGCEGVLLEYALTTQDAKIMSATVVGGVAIKNDRFIIVNIGPMAAGASTSLTVMITPGQGGGAVQGKSGSAATSPIPCRATTCSSRRSTPPAASPC